MKYRKKPIEIEAVKWEGQDFWKDREHNKILIEGYNNHVITVITEKALYIQTLEGLVTASLGDYIIKGVEGELYPCKPSIFEATYEPVEEGGQI